MGADAPPRPGPGVSDARDAQRGRVYQAENLVHRVVDRAAENPVVEIAGSRLALPPERRFGSIESVQAYVDKVLALKWVRATWPRAAVPVRVRERAGASQAHYERGGAVIAVPGYGRGAGGDPGWALRELVILHELAHHLADDPAGPSHGGAFVDRLLTLIDGVVGPETALLTRITMLDVGAAIG